MGNKVQLLDNELLAATARQEAANLNTFLAEAKMPALVVVAIDTVPTTDADGNEQYQHFQSVCGTPEAIIQLIAWLTGNIVPLLAEKRDEEDDLAGVTDGDAEGFTAE